MNIFHVNMQIYTIIIIRYGYAIAYLTTCLVDI